jgi:hypothetical protein
MSPESVQRFGEKDMRKIKWSGLAELAHAHFDVRRDPGRIAGNPDGLQP